MKLFIYWKPLIIVLLAGALLAGCVTPGTVMTRRQERPAAYAALPPEMRALVDEGRIKIGMDTNAVYLAWGQPGEVTEGESESGQSTSWTYYGLYTQVVQTWGWRRIYYNYYPVNYISAQVTFTNGIVKQWQTFPAPGY